MNSRRRGVALPITLSVIFIFSAFVFVMFRFQKHHVMVTGATVNEISALAAAEAGISCVLAELAASPRWSTHEIQSFDGEGKVTWGAPQDYAQKIKTVPGIEITSSGNGTYQGTLGEAPYQAKFKVRVGYLPLSAASMAAGSGQGEVRHLYLESLGLREDPTGKLDRATRVKVMIERLNFTEFLLYDGGWVTIGMGSYNDPDGFNIFADGRIYGHQWVHLGDLRNNGTKQKWVNLSSIRSAGQILTQSNYQIHFQAEPNLDGTPSNKPGFLVPFDPSTDSDGPGEMADSKGRILDGSSGGKLPPPKIDLEDFQLDGAIHLDQHKGAPQKTQWFSYPEFDDVEFYEVDFGRALYGSGGGDDHEPQGVGTQYGANFNGIIWSEKSIVVWGAPDRDVTIVSGGDIFVAGDFNVRETHRQDYLPDFVSEVNEDDATAKVEDAPYYTYVHRERFTERYDQPGNWSRVPPEEADRKSCALVALGNLWRDYRLPGRYMRNELLGLMAWEIGAELAFRAVPGGTPEQIRAFQEKFVAVDDPGGPLFEFTDLAPPEPPGAGDTAGVSRLTGDLGRLGDVFPFTPSDQEDPQAFQRISPDYPSSQVIDESFVLQELSKGPGERPRVPDYWLYWYVTKDTKDKLHQLLYDRLNAAGGVLDHPLLWGNGLTKGLLWEIYDLLLEDEQHWHEYKGIGLPAGGGLGYAPENTSRLALANAPQRLYNLVRDEPGTDVFDKLDPGLMSGGTVNSGPGTRSDQAGKRTEMQEDRLYMPQMTINAMIFVKSAKNDVLVPGGDIGAGDEAKLKDPGTVDGRFYELGNPRANGLHYLTTLRTRLNGGGNIISPFIQRIRGSYIRFGNGPATEPMTRGGFYYPPIRRRIYDPDLVAHPPPFIPAEAKVRSWHNVGAHPKEFEDF